MDSIVIYDIEEHPYEISYDLETNYSILYGNISNQIDIEYPFEESQKEINSSTY